MRIKIVVFLIFSAIFFKISAQEQKISIKSAGKPISAVLEEIFQKNSVKFAFDAEAFSKIKFQKKVRNLTLFQFLNLLESEYQIDAKNIDGTWVLVFSAQRNQENINTRNQLTDFKQTDKKQVSFKTSKITLSGYIKDKKTSEDLLYCNVVFGDKKAGTMTNDLGFYSLDIPPTDSIRIFISHLGYLSIDTIVSTRVIPVFYLIPFEIMIDQVKVTNEESTMLQAAPQAEKIAFNPLRTSNAPRISNDDMANSFLFVPGIDFLQGGASGISIRGGNPADNLILFDGIPVLEATHLLGNMSVLNSKFVQQAYVSRGGFDAEFGGKVAGLIELTGKSGKNNQAYIDLSANMLNTNVLLNLPLSRKLSVTTAWRRSFVDLWKNYVYLRLVDNVLIGNSEDKLESTVFPLIKFQDINSKISFHPNDKFEINLNLLYGDDHQSRDYKLIQKNEYYLNEFIESKSIGFSLNMNWQINPIWYQSLSAGFSQLDKDEINETGELNTVTEKVQIPVFWWLKDNNYFWSREKTYSKFVYDVDNGNNLTDELRVAWKTELNSGNTRNQLGIGWSSNTFNYTYFANRNKSQIQTDSIVDNGKQYLINAYFQHHYKFSEKFRMRIGIRSSFDLATRQNYWQPRAGIEFSPIKEVNFHFQSGMYNQFLSSVKRIDSEGNFNPVWYLPNSKGMGVVSSVHNIAGFRFNKKGWFINVEAYIRDTEGKRNQIAEKTNTGINYIYYYFPKESVEKVRGIDFLLEKKQKAFNHLLSYSISDNNEKMEGSLDNNWFPSNNHRKHVLKVTEMVNWKNWSATASWHFGSGLPVLDFNSPETILTDRTSNFSQLDFVLVRRFVTRHFNSNIGFSVLNVLGRNNIVEVDYLRFSSKTGALSLRSDVSSLGITPLFFASFKFW